MAIFQRSVMHADLDAFFVEVARRLDPSLIGRPVIVGGSPDARGVVCSASYEARAFGVHSAMPAAQAKRLCPQAVWAPFAGKEYGEYSARVREKCLELTPLVEMASIDEAYLDLTGTDRLHGSPIAAADRLRASIARDVGLPCTCGLGTNRVVAKVASDLAKPAGRLAIPPGSERAFLAPLSLRALPGIGPKAAERLGRYGLRTLGEVSALGEATLEQLFGRDGSALWRRVNGQDETPVRPWSEPSKSISRDRTFARDECDFGRLFETLSYLSEKLGDALWEERAAAGTVTVKIRYADFRTETRSATLGAPTRDERRIFAAARDNLLALYRRRVGLRLIGVAVSRLATDGWQLDLFEGANARRLERLSGALSRIRRRHGFASILRGESFAAVGA